jgi:hypothetical protein
MTGSSAPFPGGQFEELRRASNANDCVRESVAMVVRELDGDNGPIAARYSHYM